MEKHLVEKRVLIVEDDGMLNSMFAEAFAHAGHWTYSVYTVGQALERLVHAKLPDLIVLDLNLPDMDGADLLELLQAPQFDNVKIILTSYMAAQRAEELKKYRIDKVFIKPVMPLELVASINELFPVENP